MVLIPIPVVFWEQYTATVQGRTLKTVPCENCSTEYLYVLQREGSGTGTSMYAINKQGATRHAKAAADDTLKDILENDFDPVPCPACGHYQRYMFPKLLETKSLWLLGVRLAVLVGGCFAAVSAVRYTVNYVQNPNEEGPESLIVAWSILLFLGLVGLGQWLRERYRIRNFDPNRQDQQTRLALGRSRAVTRAEFEKGQMNQE